MTTKSSGMADGGQYAVGVVIGMVIMILVVAGYDRQGDFVRVDKTEQQRLQERVQQQAADLSALMAVIEKELITLPEGMPYFYDLPDVQVEIMVSDAAKWDLGGYPDLLRLILESNRATVIMLPDVAGATDTPKKPKTGGQRYHVFVGRGDRGGFRLRVSCTTDPESIVLLDQIIKGEVSDVTLICAKIMRYERACRDRERNRLELISRLGELSSAQRNSAKVVLTRDGQEPGQESTTVSGTLMSFSEQNIWLLVDGQERPFALGDFSDLELRPIEPD